MVSIGKSICSFHDIQVRLLPSLVGFATRDDVPDDDPNMPELDMLSVMVEEYEDIHYPIGRPN